MTELGGGVDELDVDLLEGSAGSLREARLAESDRTLLRAEDVALEHNPVFVDHTVMREPTQRSDALLGDIVLGAASILLAGFADAVHLLVELGAVEVALLTSARHRPLDPRRVPGSDTADLTKTLHNG